MQKVLGKHVLVAIATVGLFNLALAMEGPCPQSDDRWVIQNGFIESVTDENGIVWVPNGSSSTKVPANFNPALDLTAPVQVTFMSESKYQSSSMICQYLIEGFPVTLQTDIPFYPNYGDDNWSSPFPDWPGFHFSKCTNGWACRYTDVKPTLSVNHG